MGLAFGEEISGAVSSGQRHHEVPAINRVDTGLKSALLLCLKNLLFITQAGRMAK